MAARVNKAAGDCQERSHVQVAFKAQVLDGLGMHGEGVKGKWRRGNYDKTKQSGAAAEHSCQYALRQTVSNPQRPHTQRAVPLLVALSGPAGAMETKKGKVEDPTAEACHLGAILFTWVRGLGSHTGRHEI